VPSAQCPYPEPSVQSEGGGRRGPCAEACEKPFLSAAPSWLQNRQRAFGTPLLLLVLPQCTGPRWESLTRHAQELVTVAPAARRRSPARRPSVPGSPSSPGLREVILRAAGSSTGFSSAPQLPLPPPRIHGLSGPPPGAPGTACGPVCSCRTITSGFSCLTGPASESDRQTVWEGRSGSCRCVLTLIRHGEP